MHRVCTKYWILFVFTSPLVWLQSTVIGVSVCLSVCSRISKTTCPDLIFLYVASVLPDNSPICYVLPVLLMTSCLHIIAGPDIRDETEIRRMLKVTYQGGRAAPGVKSGVHDYLDRPHRHAWHKMRHAVTDVAWSLCLCLSVCWSRI